MNRFSSAIENAWIASEASHAKTIIKCGHSYLDYCVPAEKLGARNLNPTAEYYESVHANEKGYSCNNWLLPLIPTILGQKPRSLLELGTGNCMFVNAVAAQIDSIFAVDFISAPRNLHPSVSHIQADATTISLPNVDLVCSADFLEHISPNKLPALMSSLKMASPKQIHIIACYDDKHSHLTVMSPAAWLSLFLSHFEEAKLIGVECRRLDPAQVVCVIEV